MMYCPTCRKTNFFRIEETIKFIRSPSQAENVTERVKQISFRCMYCQNDAGITTDEIIKILNDYFTLLNKVDELSKLLERLLIT